VVNIPEKNQAYVNYTMGFLSGVLTTIYTYYFGSSKKQNDDHKTDIEQ
jgi:hypothetical protein